MNYLAHAYLSFGDGGILTGNLIADHVKGRLAMESYPTGIKEGIILHRKIDGFCDAHPATAKAKLFFRADYGLYSGAVTDTLFDHYLANDVLIFPTERELELFAQNTYRQLAVNEQYFPEPFKRYFPYMQQHDWFSGYRKVKGMEKALNGLARKAKFMAPPLKAFEVFLIHYFELNQCYEALMTDVIKFVKFEWPV